jgi:hypothetical protein
VSQLEHYVEAQKRIARENVVMMDLMFGANPITRAELRALIAKRPATYGRFASYLDKLI